ncbi:Hsp20/alpha crystallin family protein [Pseudoduganella ginsengisoli]|uniref:Hsp20 family protein n=1 Tax=Pseudoduganella ginsengisoli TaxID=1462440 RepID=A0A6L6Q4F0_9BURK|nr:Hsp20/alpha crystallin family protein [Pseudoduganella ginsengisoli]MTW04560.1 Hsp20 family protein [Pseudoduganella ginsengisoli]
MSNQLMNIDPFSDLARFDPFRGLDELFRDVRTMPMRWDAEAGQPIKLDVSENEQAYTVKAEIPGVKKEDIKIDVAGNRVTISAQMQRETEDKKDGTVIRRERFVGQQYRSFALAQDVDDAKAEARYEAGILELKLPKKAPGGSRKVTVS